MFNLGKLNEAIVNYDKLLKINPNHLQSISNKGAALLRLGKVNEAIAEFDKALKIDPNHLEAF